MALDVDHLLKQVGTGRAGGYGNLNRPGQLLGLAARDQERIDRRRRVEVRDALFFQELPYQRVVNLPQADVDATDGDNGPGKSPSDGVEPREPSSSVLLPTVEPRAGLHGQRP